MSSAHIPVITPGYYLPAAQLQPDKQLLLPAVQLSEQEVIDFGRQFDPQPIHTDPAAAAKSRFKGLIASGLQPYIRLHVEWWVPLVRTHFICGLSFDGAKFFEPVYPNQPFGALLEIVATEPRPDKGTVAVSWRMDIHNPESLKTLHQARFTTYHSLTDRAEDI